MARGKFITVDGIEGAGKTTHIDFIVRHLRAKKIEVVQTREPGGTILGEKIRELLLGGTVEKMYADTELLLMFAARCEHIHQKIIPALESGKWVVSDRFTDASFAYQGGGREIGVARVAKMEAWALGDFRPDLSFFLDVSVEVAAQRVAERGHPDRIEKEDADFFERVRRIFLKRAAAEKSRIRVIDSSQKIIAAQNQIAAALEKL